jgi:tRNA (guanine-N7-)-methyltransferase
MRVRNNPNAHEELLNYEKYLDNADSLKDVLKRSKGKSVNIEIGMGKGDFLIQTALKNQDKIYIGIELSMTVLALAVKKIKKFEKDNGVLLENVYIMSFDAKNICDMFDKNSISTLYLNFSDPWPKKKHSKRRLTYKEFLNMYTEILKEDGVIEFKTDNRGLFEYSLVSMNNFGLKFEEVYLDLHKENIENVVTEYEMKFCEKGPIYKIVARKN